MKFYAYIPREDGSEPLGTGNKILFELKTVNGAIKHTRNRLGKIFKLFSYTNFYDDETFRLYYDSWKHFKKNPTKGLKTERWAFSSTEIKNPTLLNSDDLLEADVGTEIGVLVYRNGRVTNRWADGTVGVPTEYAELADEVESLYHPEFGEETYAWYDVKADKDGNFVEFLGKKFRGEKTPRPLFR